jgi:hypothetical protein
MSAAPGNNTLARAHSGLRVESVALVCQVLTIDKASKLPVEKVAIQTARRSDRDFGRRGIAAALNVKTTTMTRSEQKTD